VDRLQSAHHRRHMLLIVGIVTQYDAATYGGIAIVLIFGLVAAGARKAEAEVGPVRVKAEFDAPPPPEAEHRIYLPKGWRPKKPR
jgi:hypothetical protein